MDKKDKWTKRTKWTNGQNWKKDRMDQMGRMNKMSEYNCRIGDRKVMTNTKGADASCYGKIGQNGGYIGLLPEKSFQIK